MSGFGPSRTMWSEGDESGAGLEEMKIINLVDDNQDGFAQLDLIAMGERCVDVTIPLENPTGERLGSLNNIHYSVDRGALAGNLITSHAYTESQLFLEFSGDRKRITRLVLSK